MLIGLRAVPSSIVNVAAVPVIVPPKEAFPVKVDFSVTPRDPATVVLPLHQRPGTCRVHVTSTVVAVTTNFVPPTLRSPLTPRVCGNVAARGSRSSRRSCLRFTPVAWCRRC